MVAAAAAAHQPYLQAEHVAKCNQPAVGPEPSGLGKQHADPIRLMGYPTEGMPAHMCVRTCSSSRTWCTWPQSASGGSPATSRRTARQGAVAKIVRAGCTRIRVVSMPIYISPGKVGVPFACCWSTAGAQHTQAERDRNIIGADLVVGVGRRCHRAVAGGLVSAQPVMEKVRAVEVGVCIPRRTVAGVAAIAQVVAVPDSLQANPKVIARGWDSNRKAVRRVGTAPA
jgi:hypothetical protein